MSELEIIGFITGITGVYLTARENILCFPVGLINVTISMYLFFGQKLYADVIQQIFYIILLVYGWIYWLSGKNKSAKEIPVSRSAPSLLIVCAFSILMITFILGTILSKFTDAVFPFMDSFATAVSFTAQYLVARKKIENWLLWMIVNITYIAIYYDRGLILYAVLFSIYFLLAIFGFKNWKKDLNAAV